MLDGTTTHGSGETFLLVQGTFDGVCGGLLLYLGFGLLVLDFPQDVKAHCTSHKHGTLRLCAMFAALWVGAALMGACGQYVSERAVFFLTAILTWRSRSIAAAPSRR